MSRAVEAVKETYESYDVDESLVGAHTAQAATFAAAVGIPLAIAARRGRLPERIPMSDVLLLGIATHKLSRVITRDKVTDFLRAPFTRREGHAHINEVNDKPRGHGLQRAMGELVSCPFCAGTWIAGGLAVGLVFAPRFTRVVEAAFAALSVSDLLHLAYAGATDSIES